MRSWEWVGRGKVCDGNLREKYSFKFADESKMEFRGGRKKVRKG